MGSCNTVVRVGPANLPKHRKSIAKVSATQIFQVHCNLTGLVSCTVHHWPVYCCSLCDCITLNLVKCWSWWKLGFLYSFSGLCWVCKCWWFQSCSEITDWKDVWWEVCCGYILPAECLQEGISLSNLALIDNLRTISCFSSSIFWIIIFYIWIQEHPFTILKGCFVHLFNPTNVQSLP